MGGRTGPGFSNGFGASQGYLIARPSVLVSAGPKKAAAKRAAPKKATPKKAAAKIRRKNNRENDGILSKISVVFLIEKCLKWLDRS